MKNSGDIIPINDVIVFTILTIVLVLMAVI